MSSFENSSEIEMVPDASEFLGNSNIFMEHFDKIAQDTADHKPTKWLRHVDDTFVVWPHGPEKLQQSLHFLNSFRPTIVFTMEVEANDTFHSWMFWS
jgi:hypothetical protein